MKIRTKFACMGLLLVAEKIVIQATGDAGRGQSVAHPSRDSDDGIRRAQQTPEQVDY